MRIAIVVAAAIVVAVAVILVLTSQGNSPGGVAASHHHSTGKKSQPAASQSPAPGGLWQYIAIRATDPVKLTTQELYPPGFTSAGAAYRRSAAAKATDCQASLIGTSIQAAVHRGGCAQALRATYFSRTAKVMGTIGVFNLKTVSGASAAAKTASHYDFVAQLPAATGTTHQIGQGTGIEYAAVKGHYLVLVWAEFTNLSAPKTGAQRQRLITFASALIQQTINISLSYRMANGKPSPPG